MLRLHRRCLRFGIVQLLLAAAAGVFCSPAPAASYPDHTVQIIDAFAPGGTTDFLARLLSSKMGPALNVPIVVENRAGANGVVGSQYVARAPADGYTLFVGSTATLAVNQMLYDQHFDPLKAFAPVSLLAAQPMIVVVHPSLPVTNIKELIAYAKAHPTAVNFATPGVGNPVHLATELFKKMSGAPITHVPYNRGSAAAIPDLLAGRVQLMFAPMNVLPLVQSGQLRALAITSKQRLPILPDVPTVAESGVPGYEATLWNGAVVPTGTPQAVITRLNQEIAKVLNDPAVRQQMTKLGLQATPSTPQEQEAYTRSEAKRWGQVIHEVGIKIQ